MQCEKVFVPIPSNFSKETFTTAALDEFDYQDRSSTIGMNGNHDPMSTIFHVKPDHTPYKPLISVSLKTVSDSAFLFFLVKKYYH